MNAGLSLPVTGALLGHTQSTIGSRLFDAFRSNLGRTVFMIQDARLDVHVDHRGAPDAT